MMKNLSVSEQRLVVGGDCICVYTPWVVDLPVVGWMLEPCLGGECLINIGEDSLFMLDVNCITTCCDKGAKAAEYSRKNMQPVRTMCTDRAHHKKRD
ncbi:MAG: hypothetical protein KKE11_01575 [Gammaproteobacteria bacterium]|nr:hypothetical protein [Gammaproteobacteria bacterium]